MDKFKVCVVLVVLGFSFGVKQIWAEEVHINVSSNVSGSSSVRSKIAVETRTESSSTEEIEDKITARQQAIKDKVDARLQKAQERVELKRDEIKARIDDVKEKMATKQAERKEKLEEKTKERVKELFNKMARRMKAAVDRLENILSRISTRLDKLEQKGGDVADLRTKVVDAQNDLVQVSAGLEAATEEMDDALGSEDPRAAIEVFKDSFKEAHEGLKNVHEMIRDIVVEMVNLAKTINVDDSVATDEAN